MTVHTTYFGAIGSFVEPVEQDLVLGVVRHPHDFVTRVVDRNIPALAPPADLLEAFKTVEEAAERDGLDNPSRAAWKSVGAAERYLTYLDRVGQSQVLNEVRGEVRSRTGDVWLVCWERDVRFCHRRLLADVLVRPLAVEVEHHPDPETCAAEEDEEQPDNQAETPTLGRWVA